MHPVLMEPDRLVSDGRRGGPPLSVELERSMGGDEGGKVELGGNEGGATTGIHSE